MRRSIRQLSTTFVIANSPGGSKSVNITGDVVPCAFGGGDQPNPVKLARKNTKPQPYETKPNRAYDMTGILLRLGRVHDHITFGAIAQNTAVVIANP